MARIIDVIQVANQGATDLVTRQPEDGPGDFRLGSQVIVRESQRAIFYRDGKSLDMFEAGRHTITTMSIPLLAGLLRLATSGDDIFTSEVYFVNMREFTDLKWGTPQPISLRDDELGLVRLRAFGQYTMQISDPKRFVDQIVGTQGLFRTSQIEEYLRNTVISRMTDVLGENMNSLFDLAQQFDEIGAAMRAKLQDDFRAIGISLKQFMVVSITPTDETAQAIDERASMGAIGNMDSYMKFKAARAIGDAAQQEGGSSGDMLGMGAGFGMGAGMAGMMSQAMAGAQQPGPATQQAPPVQPAPAVGAVSAPAATPEVMTLDEAAAYLQVSTEDMLPLIEGGDIKAKKIGPHYRISKSVIDAFLAE